MNLQSLGADAEIFCAFETYAAQVLVLGRVAVAQRDQYRIYTSEAELAAEASGALWYRTPDRAAMPVVGDWVAARVLGRQAIVEAVLPRRTCFSRRAAGRRDIEQPIAANIDLVFLVCGLDGDFNLRRLERYLTLAAESGAQPWWCSTRPISAATFPPAWRKPPSSPATLRWSRPARGPRPALMR